jgi:hypothetical protein
MTELNFRTSIACLELDILITNLQAIDSKVVIMPWVILNRSLHNIAKSVYKSYYQRRF